VYKYVPYEKDGRVLDHIGIDTGTDKPSSVFFCFLCRTVTERCNILCCTND
jgi:hypothetical protein